MSVSHSSTESEVISLDGLQIDGIPALDLWDVVIEELHSYETHLADNCRKEKVDDQVLGKSSTQ